MNSIYSKKEKFYTMLKITISGFFVVVVLFLSFLVLQFSQGPVLEKPIVVTIPEGYSIIQTAQLLEDSHIIYSRHLFRFITQYRDLVPKSGPYLFSQPRDVLGIIERISLAQYGDVYTNITFPEGATNEQYIQIIKKSDLNIHEDTLIKLLEGKEGYLFPDTYSFFPEATASDIVQELEKTFTKKITEAFAEKTIEKTESEIVIMASLLEKEASNSLEEKQIISGILWKRIAEGIPLQVDAPFVYERQKGSAQLSIADLRRDSFYNTYTNKGLTPTPIGNPGYDSLYAAAHPTESPYYFYLHGSDGVVHYGKNHNEHLKNKRMYLR